MGPLLFLLYVNDIPFSSTKLSFVLFADDTNIFLSHPNLYTLVNTLNLELNKVTNWFRANKLSLNVSKTNYIHFARKRHKTQSPQLKIDETVIHPVENTKFLGVIIDKNLSWKDHITKTTTQISRNVGILRKLRNTLPANILFTLYNTLILPYISYSNIAWAITDNTFDINHCPWTSPNSTKLDKLFKLQKKALRIINNANFNSHTKLIFHKYKTLNIFDINKLQTALFMYRFTHKTLPNSLSNFLIKHSDIHNYNTRQAHHYIASSPKTNHIKYSIKVSGPKIWNILNNKTIDSKTIASFKTSLKDYFINSYQTSN